MTGGTFSARPDSEEIMFPFRVFPLLPVSYNRGMVIYCAGIGGMGLSAYAAYRRAQGHTVLGSDRTASSMTEDLQKQGIDVFFEQDGSHVPAKADLFISSEALPDGSPERERARALRLPQQTYFQALGELSREHRVLAVCGTHGKSSTVAMAARVLLAADLDPSVIVGTKVRELDGRNWRKGESDLFLLEACEYRRSFHFLSPSVLLLTNVDGDHFDYFHSQEDYEQAFVDFLKKLPPDGIVVTHGSDPQCASVAERSGREIFDVDTLPLPTLQTPGEHMRRNAQLVLGLGDVLGIDRTQVLASLAGYAGCWRRMEVRGVMGGDICVIDDYGHHPSEIRATLSALREAYPGRRLVVVFQPHTHDRTLKLYDSFVTAFSAADTVIIPGIYDARGHLETKKVDVPAFVVDIAKGSHTQVLAASSLQEAEELLRTRVLRPHDVLVTMGAGTITELAGRMVGA